MSKKDENLSTDRLAEELREKNRVLELRVEKLEKEIEELKGKLEKQHNQLRSGGRVRLGPSDDISEKLERLERGEDWDGYSP